MKCSLLGTLNGPFIRRGSQRNPRRKYTGGAHVREENEASDRSSGPSGSSVKTAIAGGSGSESRNSGAVSRGSFPPPTSSPLTTLCRTSSQDGKARPARSARGSRGLPQTCRRGILSLILLLPLCAGDATSVPAQPRFPLVVSGGTHSLTVPWHMGPVTNRLNPAIIVGTERTLRPGGRLRLYHTANLGFFHHYWWMNSVFLDTELGVSHGLPLGFHADLRLGVGYMHYFWRRKSLELRDGAYVQVKDWGKPSVMVPLSLVLGYRGSSAHPLTVAPFVSAQWAAQGLFLDEIPAMTHLLLLVGVRIERGGAAPTAGR